MKIGMLFTGYGSQFVGMGKDLYDNSRSMQELFEEASSCLDKNFVKLCFASSEIELARSENAYPALFLMGSAYATLLKEEGIIPHVVAGYNVGEFTALHGGSSINFPDGLYLLSKYASLFTALSESRSFVSIQIVGIAHEQIKDMCNEINTPDAAAFISVVQSEHHALVAGDLQAIDALKELLKKEKKVKIKPSTIELGLHSSLMDPVVVNFRIYLEKVDIKESAVPVITNADAKPTRSSDALRTALVKQIHSPILLDAMIRALEDCTLILIIGRDEQLTEFTQTVYPALPVIMINTRADIEEAKKIIQNQLEAEI